MLDFLSREKTNRTYRTVVLENEYLRITFLPDLGGKIYDVLDKAVGKPMFYVNHVVKPGLIAQCGAWTSGGVEWNTGPQGHTVSCMQPVSVLVLPAQKDGSRSVAIGETERIYGTRWTVVVTLRPGRSFIEERVRIYNPTETIRPYYFWNCTAAPNTAGFRFIYPMTLGCDHSAEKFFQWPIDHGKDLSRGTNYQDASSIFAWHCDQDFFGSYNDDLDHGAVSYANHYQLPGKKAWTWGYGGFGKMHQMDLTDDDGPYNEVQTGPLLTQGQVGRLDPCEAVEWQEWWYPVHGTGGFTFANKDVAANAVRDGGTLTLRLIGTGTWRDAEIFLVPENAAPASSRGSTPRASCRITPSQAATVKIALSPVEAALDRLHVRIGHGDACLAEFSIPLDLPKREPPGKTVEPHTPAELAAAGWQDLLFARYPEASERFNKGLSGDSASALAQLGLAFCQLDSNPTNAAAAARAALATQPESGLAHYAQAVASWKCGDSKQALAEAWESSLDPITAAPGRALVAKFQLVKTNPQAAITALTGSGPWQTDPLCRDRLAFALFVSGHKAEALEVAKANLQIDPLDDFAASVLWLAGLSARDTGLDAQWRNNPAALLKLAADYMDLDQPAIVSRILNEFAAASKDQGSGAPQTMRAIPTGAAYCTAAWLEQKLKRAYDLPISVFATETFPFQASTIPELTAQLSSQPQNGRTALYLGHLLFHLGRHSEGRAMWQRAAELGAEPVVAYRALGMAAKTLDADLVAARRWLEKASQADPRDAIVARDLAKVLSEMADKAASDSEKRELTVAARDHLKAAFESGKGRSDFVALLARMQNQLGEFGETARMLDRVRVTVWEGAHDVHDLFVQSHMALGEAHLKAGHTAEALTDFNRALEYPANLATGKLENAREADVQFARGNALAALGRKADARAAWKLAADEPESKDARLEEARRKAKEALRDADP
jgi:tetratricopeptide (TPR) repeat protein